MLQEIDEDGNGIIDLRELKRAQQAKKNLEAEMYRLKKTMFITIIVAVAINGGLVAAIVFLSKDFKVEEGVITDPSGNAVATKNVDMDVDEKGRLVGRSGTPLEVKNLKSSQNYLVPTARGFDVPDTVLVPHPIGKNKVQYKIKVASLVVYTKRDVTEPEGPAEHHGCFTSVDGKFFGTSVFFAHGDDKKPKVVPPYAVENCDEVENYTMTIADAQDRKKQSLRSLAKSHPGQAHDDSHYGARYGSPETLDDLRSVLWEINNSKHCSPELRHAQASPDQAMEDCRLDQDCGGFQLSLAWNNGKKVQYFGRDANCTHHPDWTAYERLPISPTGPISQMTSILISKRGPLANIENLTPESANGCGIVHPGTNEMGIFSNEMCLVEGCHPDICGCDPAQVFACQDVLTATKMSAEDFKKLLEESTFFTEMVNSIPAYTVELVSSIPAYTMCGS